MPITVLDQGQNNQVIIPDSVREQSNCRIILRGSGNRIEIKDRCRLAGDASINLGSDCKVFFDEGSNLQMMEIFAADKAIINLGKVISCSWHTRIYCHEPAKVTVGYDCLIASGVLLTASDMHSIIDIESGDRINPAQDIVIEDHVWLASSVRVMKGVSIGKDSAIGVGAIVTTNIPPQCVAVGIPAKIIKTGTTWKHELI